MNGNGKECHKQTCMSPDSGTEKQTRDEGALGRMHVRFMHEADVASDHN